MGLNKIDDPDKVSAVKIILRQLKNNFIIYLLAVTAVVSFFIHEEITAYTVVGVIIMVIGVSFFQEYRAEKAIAALREMITPVSTVLLDGAEREVLTQNLVPEGVEGLVPYLGALKDHLHQLLGGLRSGLFYQGCKNIEELQKKARFIRITRASMAESRPHNIVLTSYEMGKSE